MQSKYTTIPEAFKAPMPRRRVLQLFGVGAGALAVQGLLVACGPAGETVTPSATAKAGGTLRLTQAADVLPASAQTIYFPNTGWINQVCDRLVRQDWEKDLELSGQLAEEWTVNEDFTQISFTIREGVLFHNGRGLTADDIKQNLERVATPEVASQWFGPSSNIASIEVPSEFEIVITLTAPRPGIMDMFANLAILAPECFADLGSGTSVIGTGAFVWDSWEPGSKLTLSKNEDYWNTDGGPYLDSIVIDVVPDAAALATSVVTQTADFAISPAYADIARLRDGATVQIVSSEAGSENFYLGANVVVAELSDKRVRQAINYSLDRDRIVKIALKEVGFAKSVPWGPNNPAWDDEQAERYQLDLDRAKELLDEAGVGSGFSTTITTNTSSPVQRDIAQIIQANLGELGIDTQINEIEQARWLELLKSASFPGLWLGTTACGNLYPGSTVTMLFPFRTKNASNFGSPEYTELTEKTASVADPTEAKQVFYDLTELMLDECFVMPFTIQRMTWAMAKNVGGFKYDPLDKMLLNDVFFS